MPPGAAGYLIATNLQKHLATRQNHLSYGYRKDC